MDRLSLLWRLIMEIETVLDKYNLVYNTNQYDNCVMDIYYKNKLFFYRKLTGEWRHSSQSFDGWYSSKDVEQFVNKYVLEKQGKL